MTRLLSARPTPPARRRERACLVLVLLALSLPACGAGSRMALATRDLRGAALPDGQGWDRVALGGRRGSDPLTPALWMVSIQDRLPPRGSVGPARVQELEDALAMTERGLAFLPHLPPLHSYKAALLEELGRDDELQQTIEAVLATGPAPPQRAEMLHGLLRLHLKRDELDQAHAVALRLGGSSQQPPGLLADAWARIALAHGLLGEDQASDEAFEASLAWGPSGLATLQSEAVLQPPRRAAAQRIAARALERHPDHPDLRLAAVVAALARGDADAAAADLALLTDPPGRLADDVETLRARTLFAQGQIPEALALTRARLDQRPADQAALELLVVSHDQHDEPDLDEVKARMLTAWRSGDDLLRRWIEALMEQLAPAPEAQDEAPPAAAGS